MAEVRIFQSNAFRRAYKRLRDHQKDAVDDAVSAIVDDPGLGTAKKGDLAGIYVHKFDCVGQRFLLAYSWEPATRTLLALGVHENFYRDLKR